MPGHGLEALCLLSHFETPEKPNKVDAGEAQRGELMNSLARGDRAGCRI